MHVISDYRDIMEILKNDDFFIEGRTEFNFKISEHKLLRNNFRDFLHTNLSFILGQYESEWQKVLSATAHKIDFELVKDLVRPFCEGLTFNILGIDDENVKPALIEYSMAIFYMKNSEYAKVNADKSTLEIASFLSKHLVEQLTNDKDNICSKFIIDKSEKSIAHLIQLLVGTLSSVPLMLANQILLLIKDEKFRIEYFSNPSEFSRKLIFLSGPMKNLYRIAGPQCPYDEGKRLKLDIKAAKNLIKVSNLSDNMPDLGLGYGMHACLGASLIKSISEFFAKAFFDSFLKIKPDFESLKYGGSNDIEGLTALRFQKIY